MVEKVTHPSVVATAAAGAGLALASTQADVPWWLWAAWATLGVLAIAQAVRS